jgi:hypothetical protein
VEAPNTTLLSPKQRAKTMNTVTTKDGTEIFYKAPNFPATATP